MYTKRNENESKWNSTKKTLDIRKVGDRGGMKPYDPQKHISK